MLLSYFVGLPVFGVVTVASINAYLYNFYTKLILIIDIIINVHTSPSPFKFVTQELKSSCWVEDLNEVFSKVDILLPQLSDFISQFNTLINNHSVTVITDSGGNMSIEVPQSMSDQEASNIMRRVRILDNLIRTQLNEAQNLLNQGISLDSKLKQQEDFRFSSKILEKVNEAERIKRSYNHH